MTSHPIRHGLHILADLAADARLDDPAFVEAVLRDAAAIARVTLLDIRLHHFGGGNGVTGVALLAESHISIHTWPEDGVAALDLFVCGVDSDPEAALDHIVQAFQARLLKVSRIDRLPGPRTPLDP